MKADRDVTGEQRDAGAVPAIGAGAPATPPVRVTFGSTAPEHGSPGAVQRAATHELAGTQGGVVGAGTPQPAREVPAGTPQPARAEADRAERRARVGNRLLTAGFCLLVGLSLMPTPYAVRMPGPVVNAVGTAPEDADDDGAATASPSPTPTGGASGDAPAARDVITVSGAPSYPVTAGALDVLTVSIAHAPTSEPSWFQTLLAWGTPSQDALPIEAYYRDNQTVESRNSETAAQMTSSQDLAKVAALRELGHQVPPSVGVAAVASDGPAAGILEVGDVVRAVAGKAVTTPVELRDAVQAAGTKPLDLTIRRHGAEQHVTVTPVETTVNGAKAPRIGIVPGDTFDLPISIDVQLGRVGGPSAGLMLTLAIIDRMTPGDLTGGHRIAGTGTIDADGTVGPIGGIRQKLIAARDAGAEAFLAPVDNCAEAVGPGAPTSVPVYAVATAGEGRRLVETIARGGDTASFLTCSAVAARAN